MYRIDFRPFDYLTAELAALWWFYLSQGLALIALGVAVIIWPELLAYLAAIFFIAIGVVLLVLGWRVRQVKRRYELFKQSFLLEP
ncbi:hypothetical protein [Chloroflexus sp.]